MVRTQRSVAALGAAVVISTMVSASALAASPSAPASVAPGGPVASAAPLGSPGIANPIAPVAIGPITWKKVGKGKDFDKSPGVYGIGQLPDGRLVVVGSVGYPNQMGAAWVSADGSTWKRLKGLKAPKQSVVYAVGTAGTTVVATGGSLADGTGFVWTSADGSTWSKPTPTSGAMYSVRSTPTGLIGAGVDQGAAMTWTTTDGLTWVPVTLAPSGRAVHVMVGADGTMVASGAVTDTDQVATPVVWTSVDGGLTWTQTILEGLLPGRWSNPAGAATPAGFVVTFSEPGQTGLIGHVWSSVDGSTWTETLVDQEGFLSAAGSAGTDAMLIGHGQVLRSPDGVTWTPTAEATLDGWSVRDVMTLADGRLFAAGDVFSSAMATWTGTAEPVP